MAPRVWKIEVELDGTWHERDGEAVVARERTAGGERLRLTIPRSAPDVVLSLTQV